MASKSGIKAGEAYVELTTRDSKLLAGLDRAGQRLKSFGLAVTAAGAGLLAIGTAATAPFVAMGKSFADAGSQLADMSKRTGLTAEQLSALKYAAEQTGAGINDVETAVRAMQRTLVAARAGGGAAKETFDALGISLGAIADLSPDEQFRMIGEALSRIPDPTLRAGLAMKVFGKSGTALLPMLEGGAKGLDDFRQRAERLGLIMTTEMAESADALGDVMDDLGAVLKFSANVIGSALAPVLKSAASLATGVAVAVNRFTSANKQLIATVFAAAAGVATAGAALVTIGGIIFGVSVAVSGLSAALGVAGAAFAAMGTAVAAVFTPMGLLSAGVVALGGYLLWASGIGGKAVEFLRGKFQELLAGVTAVGKGIVDALASGNVELAARVLWLGLKSAWLSGIAALASPLEQFKITIKESFVNGFAAAQVAWINFRDFFETNFSGFTAGITKAWNTVTSSMQRAWEILSFSLSDVMIDILGIFDSSIDTAAAKLANLKQSVQNEADINAQQAAKDAEADRRLNRTPEQRVAEKQAALAEVEERRREFLEEAGATASNKIQDAADELAKARAELAESLQEAATERGIVDAAAVKNGVTRPRFDFEGIGEAIQRATTGVLGTFNASALAGFSAGGASDRLVNLGQQQLDVNKRILRELEDMDGGEFE